MNNELNALKSTLQRECVYQDELECSDDGILVNKREYAFRFKPLSQEDRMMWKIVHDGTDYDYLISVFSRNCMDHLHDCVFHVTNEKPTEEEMARLFFEAPRDIQLDALDYGMSDTLWRDGFIKWMMDQQLKTQQ